MESCPVKSAISGGMGFALGGAFGLFMSSVREDHDTPNTLHMSNLFGIQMSYDTPLSGAGQQLADLPMKEQLRRGFRDMGSRSYSSAKSFGLIGAVFAGTECCIESVSLPLTLAISSQILTFKFQVSSKERLEKRCYCWMPHWWCHGSQSRAPGSGRWLCWLRSFQRGHRCFYAPSD